MCYDVQDVRTKEREIRALVKASKELRCNDLLILTQDYDAEEQINWFGLKRKIKFVPVWKWLLVTKKLYQV